MLPSSSPHTLAETQKTIKWFLEKQGNPSALQECITYAERKSTEPAQIAIENHRLWEITAAHLKHSVNALQDIAKTPPNDLVDLPFDTWDEASKLAAALMEFDISLPKRLLREFKEYQHANNDAVFDHIETRKWALALDGFLRAAKDFWKAHRRSVSNILADTTHPFSAQEMKNIRTFLIEPLTSAAVGDPLPAVTPQKKIIPLNHIMPTLLWMRDKLFERGNISASNDIVDAITDAKRTDGLEEAIRNIRQCRDYGEKTAHIQRS